jgi:hypothetical protein
MQINDTAWDLLMQKLNRMEQNMDEHRHEMDIRVGKLEKWRTALMAAVGTLFITKGPGAFKIIVEALK